MSRTDHPRPRRSARGRSYQRTMGDAAYHLKVLDRLYAEAAFTAPAADREWARDARDAVSQLAAGTSSRRDIATHRAPAQERVA